MDDEIYYVFKPDWDEEYLIYQEGDQWHWASRHLEKGTADHGLLGPANDELDSENNARQWLRVNRKWVHPNYSTISFNICAECDKPVAYDYLCPECRDE
jgi:hypothetical protein